MAYTPTNPLDIPPYQMQPLISGINNDANVQVRCGQALGSEIYVGCSNGDLLRFALQADDPTKLEAYTLLSRQPIPTRRPVDEIVLIPSLSRALILSDHQLHVYVIPSLEPVLTISPIRHVVTFAVDHEHLQRPPPTAGILGDQVEFCVIKRTTIMMYALRDRLVYQKEIPLPQGASLARRTGRALCIADKIHYNMVDLEAASLFPILPLSQAPDPTQFVVRPFITVVAPGEFLILSWTGASTLGLFITGEGDPVRGTLEWPNHPEAVCLDYPYITTLLPNETIEIHNVETQIISQVISAPSRSRAASPIERVSSPSKRVSSPAQRVASPSQRIASPALSQVPDLRKGLVASIGGYFVPSTERSARMKTIKVGLLRGPKHRDNDIPERGVLTTGQNAEMNPTSGVANLDVTGYEL